MTLNQERLEQGAGVDLTFIAASCGVVFTYWSLQKAELIFVLTVVAPRSCCFVPTHHNLIRGECRVDQTDAAKHAELSYSKLLLMFQKLSCENVLTRVVRTCRVVGAHCIERRVLTELL
jgi:hypothetical protein